MSSCSGIAEQGVTYVKIDITNSENRVMHTYISPVSGNGSFNYGFRVDFRARDNIPSPSVIPHWKILSRVYLR